MFWSYGSARTEIYVSIHGVTESSNEMKLSCITACSQVLAGPTRLGVTWKRNLFEDGTSKLRHHAKNQTIRFFILSNCA